ncbi:organ-specific protein S2-like [Chenopodium quinoa]|uniref:organ-specific protein S2-like n=1 Tax=Chenopodium quinoa TaxID=63459 RepID=UPI000B771EF5|nr:organ-specific protein S2-like [Chenopodium quinoa]
MESYIRILYIALLSLILLTSSSEGRKDPQTYWGDMMKGQPMPEALKDFINQKSYEGHEKKDTIITGFIKDFDPIPNISAYHDDNAMKSKEMKSQKADCNDLVHHDKLASKKLFDDEFEPIPNVSAYNE